MGLRPHHGGLEDHASHVAPAGRQRTDTRDFARRAGAVVPTRDRDMTKEIRLNAFDMNCVGHIQHGMWTHPRDRSVEYNTLEYWQDLALVVAWRSPYRSPCRSPRRSRWTRPRYKPCCRPGSPPCPGPPKVRFAPDSPLEEGGFEPSVPHHTTEISRQPNLAPADFAATELVGANVTYTGEEAGRIPRDRRFESISLQRGVYKLSVPRPLA
jgi:hypothetical protein